MSVRALVGLVLFNAVALGVGAAILSGLRTYRSWLDVLTLAGLSHLVGLAALMSALSLELAAGIPVTLTTIGVTLAALIAGGLAVGALRGAHRPRHGAGAWRVPRISVFVAGCLAGIVLYLEGLFRQARLATTLAEWDGWWNWVPKAKAIYYFGRLDPEFLSFLPNQSYPPGLPAVHAAAFHFMGSADDVTLHVQYWFYVAGFIGALAGLLATRVRPAILIPLLFLVLLAPSFVIRFTWTYADVPLGFLVATAAVLIVLWIEEHSPWQLVAPVVLLSGAVLTKREGVLLAACVFAAALAASARERRACWPRLALAGGIVVAASIPWRIWFYSHGLPDDGPSAGPVGALDDLDRGWATTRLVVVTLFEPELWLLAPTVGVAAIALGVLARNWVVPVYAGVFLVCAAAAGIWMIWSEPGFPITTDDSLNPVVRLTGTSVLVLASLTPLLLQRAWSAHGSSVPGRPWSLGPDAFVWHSRGAWAIVVAAALAYPASMAVGYSGRTLPGGLPHFPSTADCVSAPVAGEDVRVVLGYTESYPEAETLRLRAAGVGLRGARVAGDGCGRLRVFVDDIPSAVAANAVLQRAVAGGLGATLESDARD